MNIYDDLIAKSLQILARHSMSPLEQGVIWNLDEKAVFLMDKDTAVEIGGYPKESINLLIQSDSHFSSGNYVVGDRSLLQSQRHISFGKIVILQTKGIADEDIYDFTQKVLLTDSKCRFSGVMTRASAKHYFVNYKISKAAMKKGFDLAAMASTVRNEFLKLPEVVDCSVIFILGESPIYKELLPIAEKAKEITVALNHIFDGISMDCGHCDMNAICEEVQGLRALHKKQK